MEKVTFLLALQTNKTSLAYPAPCAHIYGSIVTMKNTGATFHSSFHLPRVTECRVIGTGKFHAVRPRAPKTVLVSQSLCYSLAVHRIFFSSRYLKTKTKKADTVA